MNDTDERKFQNLVFPPLQLFKTPDNHNFSSDFSTYGKPKRSDCQGFVSEGGNQTGLSLDHLPVRHLVIIMMVIIFLNYAIKLLLLLLLLLLLSSSSSSSLLLFIMFFSRKFVQDRKLFIGYFKKFLKNH